MAPSSPDGTDNLGPRQAARRFLEARVDLERARTVGYGVPEFNLQRMRELLGRTGSPHRHLAAVHVAGTKGKGSTAAMLAAVLSAAGYRTGLYTSPHLDRVEERIAIDGQPCSPEELAQLAAEVQPAVEAMDREIEAGRADGMGLTYFEVVTAMAMLQFVRRKVDVAVLEVGLGGRLDATNVCHPNVSVITSISFDHTQQLGNTLASIAAEKAGIVKPGIPVVSGVTAQEPRDVIRAVCRQRGCRVSELGVDFDFEYHPPCGLEAAPALAALDFHWRGCSAQDSRSCRGVPLRLLGRHQAANAAVALAALRELERAGWRIPEEAVRAGLAQVVWPARIEVLGRRPAVIVDGAHNVASIEALLQTLAESFRVRRRLLVFAASHDKDFRGMIRRLAASFDEVILTRYLNNPRAVSPEEMAGAGEWSGRRCQLCPTPADAWDAARSLAGVEDLICITGSLFLAAEMRSLIQNRPDRRVPAPPGKQPAC